MTKCEACWRVRFTLERFRYDSPPEGAMATCPRKDSPSCIAAARRRDAKLIRAYARLAEAQHRAILAFDAGARPGGRTRSAISNAAVTVKRILDEAPRAEPNPHTGSPLSSAFTTEEWAEIQPK